MNRILPVLLATLLGTLQAAGAEDIAKVVLVAGSPSHGPGDHEFNAGCIILQNCLAKVPGVEPVLVKGGWPDDPSVFDGARAVLFYMDGGGRHPMIVDNHLEILQSLVDKGVGIGCVHFAVEVPKGKPGDTFLDWIGGYYEHAFSTNPHWTAAIKSLPEHPITRGVEPFAIEDEWYFNIRFRPGMRGVTPLLVACPSDETRLGKTSAPRGPYKHIVEASGREEVLAWCVERPDGGRGFGFTGAHNHENWGDPNFRKLVLNAILWLAKVEVPANGVESSVSPEELSANLDPK